MNRLFIIVLVMIVVGVVLYNFNPSYYWFMPKCPFKMITGLSCPACGIQRAIYALMHGQFKEAVEYNYYLLYAGPYAMLFLVEWLLPNGKARNQLASVIENKYVVDFYILTFLLWLVVRNIYNI